ncbi:hypothetical protein GGX14DRAFT_470314, partial [Mycena pura]
MQLVWKVLGLSLEILVECTLIMRVFAMHGRNWWILMCLLAVFSCFPAFAIWDNIKDGLPPIMAVPGISGCVMKCSRAIMNRFYTGVGGAWSFQSVFWHSNMSGPTQFQQIYPESPVTYLSSCLPLGAPTSSETPIL